MKNLLEQLYENKRKIDFDTFDITTKELVSMVSELMIDISPEYQRQFRWTEDMESLFIESVLLGIPVPSLFMVANKDGTWELIDGVQRLSTVIHFMGDESLRKQIDKKASLKLKNLEKLSSFNEKEFDNLPQSVQLQFALRPLKITTISDKSDFDIRFDLFERLNTGGIKLKPQEIRACIFRGDFNDLIRELSLNKNFRHVLRLSRLKEKDGTREEMVLRFFAFLENYNNFGPSVKKFFNNYMAKATKSRSYKQYIKLFEDTFKRLHNELPQGIIRGNRKTTPIILYEAVAVGAALAIMEGAEIRNTDVAVWMNNKELKILTTGATNSSEKVKARIEYCKNKFMKK